ncbi:hypothetical protein LOD99_622 [Oopsacas minuta]|uniref:Transmembrane protein 131 n=1 Tax=Oopsacas minuta TaxID=111878 RepID=A0AAV7JZ19_9METZ|nr:hypothetical protein LOD99_622 [Oopsacas minuta]
MAMLLTSSFMGVFPLRLISSLSQTTKSTALYLLIISCLLLVPHGIPHSDIPNKAHQSNPLAADSSRPDNIPTCTLKNGLSRVTPRGPNCPGVHKFYDDDKDTLSSMLIDNLVEFVPSVLWFNNHPVGQHTDKRIQIINHSQKRVLHLTSVSGTSSDFHPSFFQSEFILPGEHTCFDVYFLPREVGPIESTLHIHSEDGFTFPLPVSGTGTANPYHVHSLSARIPLNYSYSPTVSVYNPHENPLQITEMYSTALDLHLELLSSDESSSWEVPPYQSKEVMRLTFFADRIDRYTAFIRIRTNFDKDTGAQLIIPLEVEVVSRENIVSTSQELDFGLIRSSDELKSLNISLYNPSDAIVKVSSLSASKSGRYLTIQQYQHLKLDPGIALSVGVLKLNPRDLPLNLSLITGSVLVNVSSGEGSSKWTDSIRIPYRASIVYGHLNVPNLNLHSSTLPSRPQTVSVWLSHTFRYSLALFDAKISYGESGGEETGYLSLHEFHWPLLILPHDRAVILSLRFMPSRALINSHSYLQLYTNTSNFQIPIRIYNQQLELTDGASELEFGVIHPDITKNQSFKLRNMNADVITVREMIISNPHLTFEKMVILPLQEGQLISMTGSDVPFVIQSKHEATLHYKLTRPTSGDVTSEVILVTDHQRLHVRVHYRSISGTLEAQRIVFQPSFPGHVEKKDIIIRNTFTQTVRINDLRRIDPTDPRIYLEDPSIGNIELSAFSSTHIAKLAFDPIRGFPGKVFTGGFSEVQSTDWLSSLDLRGSVAEVDTRQYERIQAVWKECQNEELTRAVANFELDTDFVSGVKVEVEASLQWPSITPDAPIQFPLTLIGNYSTRSVPVFNPGDLPLVVQALLLHIYPDEQAALDIVDDWLDIPSFPTRHISPFSLIETPASGIYHYPDTAHPTSYLEALDRSVSDFAWTYVLPPKSVVNITVAFEPLDEESAYSVILFRNNLTVMDAVVIQGCGAEGKFSLDGKMPDSMETLFFNMTEDNLIECTSTNQISPSALSLTHKFIARNQGQLPIHIESLSINGYPCQGYGFSIRQCKAFTLKPNTSVEIDITFTPDFTLYYIHRDLILMTRHGQKLIFKLYAVIAADYLPLCSRVTMKASWEPYLPYITLPVLLAALILAIYLSLQPEEEDILNMPIPGMRTSYSAEGMDKVFKLADMFSFSKGLEEDPEDLKRKLEKSSALVKSIVNMHRQVCGEREGEKGTRIGAIISPIQSPIHQDLMDIMHSSYVPDLSFRVSNGSSSIIKQDSKPQNGTIGGIATPQKTSVVKPIQILEKESQINRQLVEDLKQNNSSISPNFKANPTHITEQFIEIIPKNRNEEKKDRNIKSDIKSVLPSNEDELKRDSPTTQPTLESKKLFQPIRTNRYKKSKSKKQKEKDRSKSFKTNSPTSAIPEVQPQGVGLQEAFETEVIDENLSDNLRKPIVNSTKQGIYQVSDPKTDQTAYIQVTTPPKGPLPLHTSMNHEGPKYSQTKKESLPESNSIPTFPFQCDNTQKHSVPSLISYTDRPRCEDIALKKEEDKSNISLSSESSKGLRNSSDVRNNVATTCPVTLPKSTQSVKDRLPLAGNIPSVAKEITPNYESKVKKISILTRDEDRYTGSSSTHNNIDQTTTRGKASVRKGESAKDEPKSIPKRVPFSGMSEELKLRIEQVCAPLTIDSPNLTGETHEQLSSILSTDAEPFVPDANVLRKLLGNYPMPQSMKSTIPRDSQEQSGVLDQQTLSQLSVLLQNQAQCCVPQGDYINLLANSLGMPPRILSLHVQYCWLCYHCNLVNVFGNSTSNPKSHVPLDIPSLLKQFQDIGQHHQQQQQQQHTVPDKSGSSAILGEAPSESTLKQKSKVKIVSHPSCYTSNTNAKLPASNSTKWSRDNKDINASTNTNKSSNLSKVSGITRENTELLGAFSHWSEKFNDKKDSWKLPPNNNKVTGSHDDSFYFKSNMEYEDIDEGSLSRSDPWRRKEREQQWSHQSPKQEPPSLSASELLPTELMTSRPPSPSCVQVAKPKPATRTQTSTGQQPLIFLEKTIWSDRESVTEADRINSWKYLTGKFAQQGNTQSRERVYNPFPEGSWGPLEDIDKRKKCNRPE